MDLLLCSLTFQRIVEEGSMVAAAKALDLSASVVTKRLHWLEQQLGVQLLKRTTRKIYLTEAGSNFYQRSAELIMQWQSLVDESRGQASAPKGTLRVGATQATGSRFLATLMDEFLKLYPQLELELLIVRRQDVPDLNLDLFITPEREDLDLVSFIGCPLLKYRRQVYGSPLYLKKSPEIQVIEDLDGHCCLNLYIEQRNPLWEFEGGSQIKASSRFRSSNTEAMIASAVAGLGLIMLPAFILQRELSHGELVAVLPEEYSPVNTLYAYYPKLDYAPAKTRVLLDFLKNKLRGC